ncbi:transcriptional regulator [Planococcus glaciei]|uniref:Regulatory protein MsrR n=1 Tax=Planococcus glaciei TaxID=459472 RepID=A0A7H8QEI7_9BACL|nr:LCP family protein [Planococcus glaciei]KOF11368.1 transcriptional regulator [Planococcus glaciei]MBX0314021.1 LCP family protein [Planococcus glaciei]QKX52299.1 LCP family protein [Planococcus glaciei]
MEEELKPSRSRRKRKRLRFRGILFLLLLAIVAVGIYAVVQFQSGYKLAENTDLPKMEFDGDPENADFQNILIIGVDSRGEEKSRSDTMMLMSHDKNTDEVKLTSFMRDIYADIPGYQSYKLNTAYYLGGANLLADTLREMFGVEIHHVAQIDFANFEQMVDIAAPNGVEVDVEKDMSEKIGVSLKKGVHDLNGKELLGYARFRADNEGDFGRVRRQQQVLAALKDEMISVSAIPKYPKLAGAVQGYIETDLPTSDQVKLAIELAKSGKSDIGRLTVPVKGTFWDARYPDAGAVLEIDVEQNRQALSEFLSQPLN